MSTPHLRGAPSRVCRAVCSHNLPPSRGPRSDWLCSSAASPVLPGSPIRLAIATSPDTMLRRVKRLQDESKPPPRFIGIDDWAWRKGHRYGTIIVDLERGDVVDLLPDRGAETVKKWLENHPGVELVTRDRSATYAQAAAEGAPLHAATSR